MENRSPDPLQGKDVPDDKKETRLPPPRTSVARDLGSTRVLSSHEAQILASQEQLQRAAIPVGQEGSLLGEFQIIKKLGEGAMGAVFLARQPSYENRLVALKVLFPHVASNQKLVNRLHLEAEVMFDLDHPNIVKSLGVDEHDGWHYIVMEYVDGESLQKWINRLGKIPVADAVYVAIAIARALEYAHAQNAIHRDIKPDNVLISRSGKVKVTDLGMVKKLETDEEKGLTMTGHAVGTPWYMPLEQARNAKEADARCDIYSLGCLLYCMLTGHPPFAGTTIIEVIQAKEAGTFPPARTANVEVPERLDLIIAKMAHKQPKYRYASCGELIVDLESLNLAGDRLEFLREKKARKPAGEESSADPSNSMAGTVSTRSSGHDTDGDKWYVRMKSADGQIVVKTMLTPQMMKMVEEGTLGRSVQISRSPKEGYRALATFKEFQSVAQVRASRKTMDRHNTTANKRIYDQIVKKEIQRDVKKKEEVSMRDYWIGIGIRAAIGLVAGSALLYGLYLSLVTVRNMMTP